MNTVEDDDIRLQRASIGLISRLQLLLNKTLYQSPGVPNDSIRERDLTQIINLIEPFQEDPQLLDSQLATVIPALVDAYLQYLGPLNDVPIHDRSSNLTVGNAICHILNCFCKVRGEKIIKGFLNNEPRYLEPLLAEFEANEKELDWEERYILLLWLSHLMLAPFPLASMSQKGPVGGGNEAVQIINLPPSLPGIASRIIPICLKYLDSPTKERSAAAVMLVRLSLRPDMRQIGLLDSIVDWSVSFFKSISVSSTDIHRCLGILSLLSGLVTSATHEELGELMQGIYNSCQRILNQTTLDFVKSSAVARKLIIKTLRNILIHCLQAESSLDTLDVSTLLEEVIQFLLETMGDTDTPVRFASSKALSIIVQKLDPEMAGDVIDAIIGSLNEDILWKSNSPNLGAVDPLRWHGLSLTLSHLLYRRAIHLERLPDVINSLLLALNFEQRSSTGGSLGTNVRDAACFGIWALSRRYSTQELTSVNTGSVKALGTFPFDSSQNLVQLLAVQLVASACLDPAGNIRRGSSAALQELVGRHPDTVLEGISLIQAVSFQGVGLRQRALAEITVKVAALGSIYWSMLFEGLLGWRGVGSLDIQSRDAVAEAIGRLARVRDFGTVEMIERRISSRLAATTIREVEERHGLLACYTSLIDHCLDYSTPFNSSENNLSIHHRLSIEELVKLAGSSLLSKVSRAKPIGKGAISTDERFYLPDEVFNRTTLRPELTASAVCRFLSATGRLMGIASRHTSQALETRISLDLVIHLLNMCISRTDDIVLQYLPSAVIGIVHLLDSTRQNYLVDLWLSGIENASSHVVFRAWGEMISLAAIYPATKDITSPERIVSALTARCGKDASIQTKVVALKALKVLVEGINVPDYVFPSQGHSLVIQALIHSLNDYTINERGDVGSLVRTEALNVLESTWTTEMIRGSLDSNSLYAIVIRLSVEKLDRVRLRASQCLARSSSWLSESVVDSHIDGVSSYAYFANRLNIYTNPNTSDEVRRALLEGYAISAGGGSESVMRVSRLAFVDAFSQMTVTSDSSSSPGGLDLINTLLEILKTNIQIDRIAIPLLEIVVFVLDMDILLIFSDVEFKWRNLLSLTMKAHYKSSNLQRLILALDIYRGLARVEVLKDDVLRKLARDMLPHRYAKIRIAAAETLYMITGHNELKWHDWSSSPKDLRHVIDSFQKTLIQ